MRDNHANAPHSLDGLHQVHGIGACILIATTFVRREPLEVLRNLDDFGKYGLALSIIVGTGFVLYLGRRLLSLLKRRKPDE